MSGHGLLRSSVGPGGGFGCRSAVLLLAALLAAPVRAQDDDLPAGRKAQDAQAYEQLLLQAQNKLLKGSLTVAAESFQELLDALTEEKAADRPSATVVLSARAGLLEIALRRGKYEDVLAATAGLPAAEQQAREPVLLQTRALQCLGRYDEAATLLRELCQRDAGDLEARCRLGELLYDAGQRAAAQQQWQAVVKAKRPQDGLQLAFLGRAHWHLGGKDHFEAASQALVESLKLMPGRPEARTTFGILKYDAYAEAAGFPSGEHDLKKVLEAHGDLEEALLAMYRIRSGNFSLEPAKTEQFLDRVLALNPRSVPALVARGANILDDRSYRAAALLLDQALEIDPHHRLALAHRAAAAFLLHDDAAYGRFRDRALAGDPGWPEVDRLLGDHLVALYRFADALPFYQAALQQEPQQLPALQGMAKALVYCGEGERAKELLLRAKAAAPGLVDPWRNNALAVQQLLDSEYTSVESGPFTLQLHRDDAEVLREYLMPVHLRALEELGKKYDYRPEHQVKVEVFKTWDDFSVRTIGFRGFTALGACFGPFITLVSPVDVDVRKQEFMWEATVWHEYTHVLTLGLSRHRVPRWLTEGFSVYEEKQRDPAWERGMDRELFDAFHNQDIPPLHLLNRVFRGPRILFGYYMGGLCVELIARDFGFAKAIALLQAFGQDLDLEDAMPQALGIKTVEFDARFLEFVGKDKLKNMRLVPHYDDAALVRLRHKAAAEPDNVHCRVQLAWACIQHGDPIDAGRYLAEALRADPQNGSAQLVRAALLAARKADDEARQCWEQGFRSGADDFDSRIAYGRSLLAAGDQAGAEAQFQRAKACWPGCTEQANAPELLLARLYRAQDQNEQALMELKSYCRRSGRAYEPRWQLAEFEQQAGHRELEARYLEECNRIDPFARQLHERLAAAYVALGNKAGAALEYEMAAAVPPAMDRQYARRGAEVPKADAPEELQARAESWLAAGKLRQELGDHQRARALLERVLKEAAGSTAAAGASELLEQWRGR